MSQAIPKYMLLDETSEEIRDRRIMPLTDYKEQGDRAIVTKKNVITNTIPMSWKLSNKSSIYNLQYSSKYGILLIATDNEVAIKTTTQLEEDLITGAQNQKISMSVKFSGELFLSPDEEILAICSESLLQFVKVASLKKSNNIEAPPVPNLNESNHYLWVDNTHFLGWKFEGQVLVYTIDPSTLQIQNQEKLPIQSCTGASIIHDNLFLIEKMKIKIFEPITSAEVTLKVQIDMTDPGHEQPSFEFSYIIDIFKVNIKDNTFTPNDIFGLAVVFYDEDQEATELRYMTFAKGNIFERDTLELRGVENFYSTKTSRELFYINEDDKEKASFSIKRVIASGFICIMLEKSQKVYVIDPLEEFERINIYDIKSKHELKNEEGKFLQGMALMKNMLKIQRTVPEKAESLLKDIVSKYNGQFISLYFKDKESNLTLTFPSSLLAIGGDKFYRRYAINTVDAIDDDSNDIILQKISKINKSPNIISDNQIKSFSDKNQKLQKPAKRQQKKQPAVQVEKQTTQKAPQAKKQQKKPSENAGFASIFNNPKPAASVTSASDLFGKLSPISGANLFGQGQQSGNHLFGGSAAPAPAINLLGSKNQDDKKQQGDNLFIAQPPPPSPPVNVFGLKKQGQEKQSGNNLFSLNTPMPIPINLFGSKDQGKTEDVVKLFEKPAQATQNLLFGSKSDQAPSLFPVVTNLFAANANPPLSQPASTESNVKSASDSIFGSNTSSKSPFNLNATKIQPKAGEDTKTMFNSFFGPPQEIKPATITNSQKDSVIHKEIKPEIKVSNESKQQKKGPEKPLLADLSNGNSFSAIPPKQQQKKSAQFPKASGNGVFGQSNQGFSRPQAPNNNLFGTNTMKPSQKQQARTQLKQTPQIPKVSAAKPIISNNSNAFPAVPKKEQKTHVEPAKADKASTLPIIDKRTAFLQGIKSKVAIFVSWQKETFENPLDKAQKSYQSIKETCKAQELTLKNLDSKIFGETLEEIRVSIENSIVSNPKIDLILTNQSQEVQQVEARFKKTLNSYEELSNKMIYYTNLLGKKKAINIRASMSQSQLIDKATSNLRRITEQNEKKIAQIEQQSIAIHDIIHKISEQRLNKRKKKQKQKGKIYNFQDFDSDEAQLKKNPEKTNNSHGRKNEFIGNGKLDIKPAIISLNDMSLKPKIQLAPFEKQQQPAVQKSQAPKKVQQPQQAPQKTSSFNDRIPPKKEKVAVPVVQKVQVKKQQEKQAISEAVSDDEESEPQIPAARRQVSSIQPAQVKSIKLPAATSEKSPKSPEPTSIFQKSNAPAPSPSPSLFDAKKPTTTLLAPPKQQQNTMLHSQTTSIFSSSIGNLSTSLQTDKKSDDPQKKTAADTKPTTSLFGASSQSGFGNLFGKIQPPKVEAKDVNGKDKISAETKPVTGASNEAKAQKKQLNLNIFGVNANASPFLGDPKKGEKVAQIEKKDGEKNPDTKSEQKAEGQLAPKQPQKPAQNNLFNKIPPAPSIFGAANPTEVDKTDKNKPLNNMFSNLSTATTNNPPTGIFGGSSIPAGSSTASTNIFGKVNQSPLEEKKPEDKPKDAEKKDTVQPQKPKQGGTLAQPPTAPSPITPPAPKANQEPKKVTEEVAQPINSLGNNILTAPTGNIFANLPSNTASNNPTNTNTSPSVAPPANNQPAQQGGFMNTSFGNNMLQNAPTAPQFGVGNNKFMNNANNQQQNKNAFDPNAAKFGFASTSQKTFGNVGSSDGNIFQQNQNTASTNQFTTQSNMFSQNTNSVPSFGSAGSFGNNSNQGQGNNSNQGQGNNSNQGQGNNSNQGQGNAFNNQGVFNNSQGINQQPNMFPNTNNQANNQANTNMFANNLNNNNAFGNKSFGNTNNNAFTNNANTGFSNNNNAFGANNSLGNNNNAFGGGVNMFANNTNQNNNNNMFANNNNNNSFGGNNGMSGNNNNNQNTNFLSKIGQSSQVAPPAGAVSSHLMQMRK